MHEARRLARINAEKRHTLTAGSGQKLGGAPVRRGEDVRKVIAAAAIRRATITKGCASGIDAERERELDKETNNKGSRTKAEEDDADEEAIMIAYIDLIQEEEKEKYGDAYIPPSRENPAGSQGGPMKIKADPGTTTIRASPVPGSTKPIPPSARHISVGLGMGHLPPYRQPPSSKPSPPVSDSWTCDVCTLVNPANYLCCDACSSERPSPPPSPAPTSQGAPSTQSRPSSIRDTTGKKAIKSLISLDATTSQLPKKPIGWSCHQCGNYMESEWWTCARCGSMKLTS